MRSHQERGEQEELESSKMEQNGVKDWKSNWQAIQAITLQIWCSGGEGIKVASAVNRKEDTVTVGGCSFKTIFVEVDNWYLLQSLWESREKCE